MAVTRTPRERWIEQGLVALGDGGPAAVRVESLARDLGVTKGGFYWHFDDRATLLDAMLDAWERRFVDEVIEEVEGQGGDPREKLRRLFGLAAAGGRPLVQIELAVRDWARRDAAVARRLRRVDERRVAYMRPLFAELSDDEDDVEARCLLVMSLFIGSNSVVVDHRGRRRRDVVADALERLLR
ncbi:MAG TPA: TetR/AcrR family transcriptional regulator [Acidimicrobiales bacterium]|nr:TetR/AcrR family transcriptional regulator [Acidimicrobiales bacterium]